MSAMVTTGKRRFHGWLLAGSRADGPVVPMQWPSTLMQMMKKRAGSSTLPGPTRLSHQPSLPVTGWLSATNWSQVSGWQISTAFDLSAFRVP